ncbi:MAG: AlwI family type II restriction endonuclease [Candidatus Pseudoruminococcus sp.]
MVSKAKPLSFSTTIRNPARIPAFLHCILPYEGMLLTSKIIHKVIKNVIREKEYTPTYVSRIPKLKAISKSEDSTFTDTQLEDIILNSPQQHKEAGFDYGWDSRFDTWYKMIKEFGFIKYSMNNPIEITKTGHMIVDAYMETPSNEKKIQQIFLNALMKYQTNNPLRKNLNENAPLPLLLNVIKHFHEDKEENDAGLARHELPILICWRNNDSLQAYKFIKGIRKQYGFTCSDEVIYTKCLELLESTNKKYLKIEKICGESVDEYIRKMRMSGLLSLRGNGRFLDINSFESDTALYVMQQYMKYPKFDDENSYIDYMGEIDTNILQLENAVEVDFSDVRKNTLYKYAETMSKDNVIQELRTVCNKKESKDDVLKYISAPTRLEFLTSIALVQHFKGLDVKPNYAVDDEGLPTFTASGGIADIECFDNDYDSYFEVTLMRGRQDQVNNEIIPISRHLREVKKSRREDSFSVFIAPIIHEDTKEAADWQKFKYKIDILTFSIEEFINAICQKSKASELLNV